MWGNTCGLCYHINIIYGARAGTANGARQTRSAAAAAGPGYRSVQSQNHNYLISWYNKRRDRTEPPLLPRGRPKLTDKKKQREERVIWIYNYSGNLGLGLAKSTHSRSSAAKFKVGPTWWNRDPWDRRPNRADIDGMFRPRLAKLCVISIQVAGAKIESALSQYTVPAYGHRYTNKYMYIHTYIHCMY